MSARTPDVRGRFPATSSLQSLLYLDGHLLLNRVRSVLRSPRRLVPWTLFLIWLVAMLPLRLGSLRRGTPPLPGEVVRLLAVTVPGICLAVVGLALRRACERAPGAFSSPADARFLCGSGLSPRMVVLWLQLRKLAALSLGYAVPLLVWVGTIPAIFHFTLAAAAGLAAAMAMLTGAVLGLQLPVFVLAQRRPRLRLPWIALGLAGIGLAATVVGVAANAGALGPPGPALQNVASALPPGSWLVGSGAGSVESLAALAALAALLALATTGTVLAARDCYPELWESSTRRFTVRRLFRQRRVLAPVELRRALDAASPGQPGSSGAVRTAHSAGGGRVPGGAWTILWKEWLTLRRQPNSMRWALLVLAGSIAAGGLVGELYSHGSRAAGGAIVTMLVYGLFLTNSVRPVRLAGDLRNPLWWLSAAELRLRLGVWTLASSLRQFVPISLAAAIAAVLSGSFLLALVAVLLAFSVLWDLRAIGLATYSLIPSAADMKGPGAMLRIFAMLALAIPIALAIVPVLALTHRAVPAFAAGFIMSLTEGWLLIALAARRLRGNGLIFARGEPA